MGRKPISDIRVCINCHSTKTYVPKSGKPLWRKHNGSWMCKKCYTRLFDNPKYNPKNRKKWNPINNPKRIRMRFKNKSLLLKENPRKGFCSWCGKEGYTHIHHIEYHPEDPLKDTVELCASCHTYETHRLGQIR